jgi:hypothetical protein
MDITIILKRNECGDYPIALHGAEATDFIFDPFGVSVLNGESVLIDELDMDKIGSILITDYKEDKQ